MHQITFYTFVDSQMLNFNWANWSDFLAMGGYGLYVWGSFGVSALVMGAELLAIRARRAALRNLLADGSTE